MKKLNNKGFAISTMLYGLSIMGVLIVLLLMSIMSSNRINTANFVNQIEDDLNRFSLTETTIRSSAETTGAQEYIVPYGQAGWYKIELWGASGGDKNGHIGGKGAYTSGVIYLEENTHLYFYIGTQGTTSAGGKNGGGPSNSSTAGGGGATGVRMENGNYEDTRSVQTRIMVAAGGGGATNSANGGNGGTLQGYTTSGGAGSATQISGNFITKSAGGGAGFRNGGVAEGGSSYISGYAGVSSYKLNTSTNTLAQETGLVAIDYKEPIYNTETGDFTGSYYTPARGYRFINGFMVAGANKGDGKANIQKISESTANLPTKSNLTNVKMIIDCTSSDAAVWQEVQAIANGVNVVKTASTVNTSTSNNGNVKDGNLATTGNIASPTTQNCLKITLNSNTNLDEVAVWHKSGNINKHSLRVCTSTSESSCRSLSNFDAVGDSDPIVESVNGLHYSAYRTDTVAKPADGVYYIIPVVDESVTLTTSDPNAGESLVTLKGIDGTRFQKWSIQNLDGTYYKILGTQNNYAFQYREGTPDAGEYLVAPKEYFGNQEEKWQIIPTTNGRYIIKSQLGSKLNKDGSYVRSVLNSYTGQSTKFYLVNVDY